MVPDPLQGHLVAAPVFVSDGSAQEAGGVDLAELRAAIHDGRKMAIAYFDESGHSTERKIWPVAVAYYVDVTLIGAWCELRNDFRHFRVDRVAAATPLDERFPADRRRLLAEWLVLKKERPGVAS